MDNRLLAIKNALNQIEVRGKDNLDMLLGCILTLEKIVQEAEQSEQDQTD